MQLLRGLGVTVPTGQVVTFVEAAATLGPAHRVDLYWAGRTTLVSHHEDMPSYDLAFRTFFGVGAPVTAVEDEASPDPIREVGVVAAARAGAAAGDEEEAPTEVGAVASDLELLRHRRFDLASEEELRAMRRLMARIPLTVPRRVTRRTEPASRGRHPDLRRSIRQAIQTDGELVRRAWRRRRTRPRPLVLVLDVSGSMAGYARALLQFAYSVRNQPGAVEVFCFGTRLTRITRELHGRDPDRALATAAARVVDWDGGTWIGASLASLNRQYGRQGLLRGGVVVVCSDGLERGDPDELADAMARIRRFAHAVVWVNPLSASARFAPVQRGMRAALPFVDRLVSGHDIASLDELARVVAELR